MIYSITEKQIDEMKDPALFDSTKSYFFSPNFLCQPFLTYGKNEADEANFYNDWLENPGARMINDVMKVVCENLEFDNFPFTDSLTETEQAPVIELTDKFNVKTWPKLMHNPDLKYASAVLNIDTWMNSFDHCTLWGGAEYLWIKGWDLSYASHPNFPDKVIFVPMANPDLGLFVLKYEPNLMKWKDVKEFMDFCWDLIGWLEGSEDKKIDTLFLPCFKSDKKNYEYNWMKGYCFGKVNL